MKKLTLGLFLSVISVFSFAQDGVVFHEGFEGGIKPDGWTQEKVVGVDGSPTGATVDWQYLDGGYFEYPDHAYQGNYNAMFQKESYNGEATILITPVLDLSEILKPELRFAHVQKTWFFNDQEYNDILNVYYKRGVDSSWVLLKSYEDPVEEWALRDILLPDSSLSSTYYIGFEGISGYGYGTCIDTVQVIETGIISKYINNYTISQASTDFIPTNTFNNQILKIVFDVQGNHGTLFLDSLKVSSLNTDDSHIANNGVKLYATEDSTFKDPILIGSGANFVDGHACFRNINYDLPRGFTTVWVTYDIATAVDHNIHNSVVDAKIEAEGICISGSIFPYADKSPDGERLLKEAIFNDTFESDLGWDLNGSFERAIPQGLGGNPGYPDPENAYNGSYLLGTDLTTDGVYSNLLTNRQDSAVSPTFDCFYYKDVTLYFVRWLNIEFFDNAYIDLSNDNAVIWNQIWKNSGSVIENSWSTQIIDLNNADFKKDVNLRFALGSTNAGNQFTGWNIDDFILVGDFITKDVGVTHIIMPETGCGHTTSDDVSIYIENFAGEATPSSIPVRYEIDGSEIYETDAYASSIAIGDSVFFTFSVGADLSAPGFHTIMVETILPGDEISNNNSMSKTIFSFPTYTTPYSENFEATNGYFLLGGINSSWEYGEPAGTVINSAASGTNAWVTNLDGNYLSNDSSFLESPCFDFTDKDSIIFEFKANGETEDKLDGLNIMYSIDQGTSWNLVPDDDDFDWYWYNEPLISALELPGIDTTDDVWRTFKQILPPEVSNQSSVKFRFMFESNESVRYEGFGIDDVKIYEAPYDVGVTSLDYPFTDCEWNDTTHVKVYVENYGITDILAGTKIPLSLNFESEVVYDTLTLISDLDVEDSTLFTFNTTVDMSYAGDFDFIINTDLESNTYFFNDTLSNDTLYSTISVTGMPNYDLGWIVGSDDLDTLLDATSGYAAYSWYHLGSEVSTSQTYRATAAGIYYVTITNSAVPACQADDSLKVVPSLIDVKMDSIRTELEDSCQRFELTEIWAAISNNGTNLIDNTNDTIPFGYQINDLEVVHDTLYLEGRNLTKVPDPPNDTISFKFDEKCDLTGIGEYTISVFTNFADDLNRSDDTVTTVINTWGLPDVELAYDTIYSSLADTLTLDAGEDFATYTWNSGSAVQTETPTNSSYYYIVTVTDSHTCGTDKDSTYIETHDFGITAITSPLNICEDLASATTAFNVELTNYSGIDYTSANVTIFYEYDGGIPVEVDKTTNVEPSLTEIINVATIDVTDVGQHSLKVYTSSDIDANHTNDTLEYTFNTWPLPDVDLAYDTIFTTKADTVILVAQDGFASYTWNDASTNDSLIVTDNFTQKYFVTVTDENGCGTDSDSTYIITYNLGVSDLVAPLSACEHGSNQSIIISITNHGNDVISQNTVIPVGYVLNGGSAINENFTLGADLDPQKTVNYTFTNKEDLSAENTYSFNLFTNFENDVVTSNDTLIDVIKTFGNPSIELGDDINTTQADTVLLVGNPGFKGYFWDDGTNNDTLEVSYLASRLYTLTVSDINGCTATDNINVFTYNVAPSSILTPVSQCELSNSETVSFIVENSSMDTLFTGETINVSYTLNSGTAVNESFNLTDTLDPAETVNFTFTQTADLSVNQTHQIDLTAQLASLDVKTDDGITANVDYQTPIFDLGSDVTTGGTEYIIDAGTGYSSYLWFDNSVTQTYTVDINDQNPNNYYAVTVTTSDGCSANDSLLVTFTTIPDLEVTEMSTPISDCWNATETYPVHIEITNSGVINLNPGTSFTVGYTIDGGTAITETFNLSTAMDNSDTREHTFADEISFASSKVFVFKTFAKLSNDGNVSNDTLVSYVDISSPIVILGANDTVKVNGDSYIISPSESYSSYLWSDANSSTTPTLTVTESGTYSVTITDGLGCSGEGSIYIDFITDIENLIQGDGYKLTYFPNPASEDLMVQFENQKSKDVIIEIISGTGQILYNNKISNVENDIEKIDVSPYSNGVYFLRFRIDDKFYLRKLIIQ